jgi:hypothetical protein
MANAVNQSFVKPICWIDERDFKCCHCEVRIGVSLNQSVGLMQKTLNVSSQTLKLSLKTFPHKLTDCFVALAMTEFDVF